MFINTVKYIFTILPNQENIFAHRIIWFSQVLFSIWCRATETLWVHVAMLRCVEDPTAMACTRMDCTGTGRTATYTLIWCWAPQAFILLAPNSRDDRQYETPELVRQSVLKTTTRLFSVVFGLAIHTSSLPIFPIWRLLTPPRDGDGAIKRR